jgi:hypothetical protein
MGIIGRHPETGLRIDVARPRDGGPPWTYDGHVATADAEHPVRVTVAVDGDVDVHIAEGAPPGTAEKARLIVRAAYKHAKDADPDAPPPRRIQRWRAE